MSQQPPYNPNDPGNIPPQSPGPNPYASGGSHGGGRPNTVEAKGFFAGLFDLSFTSFVTIKFAKFIYIIVMVAIGLWALFGWLIGSIVMMTQEPITGFLWLLLGWIPVLLALIFARITLEFYVAMARTAQNTGATRAELERIRGLSH